MSFYSDSGLKWADDVVKTRWESTTCKRAKELGIELGKDKGKGRSKHKGKGGKQEAGPRQEAGPFFCVFFSDFALDCH